MGMSDRNRRISRASSVPLRSGIVLVGQDEIEATRGGAEGLQRGDARIETRSAYNQARPAPLSANMTASARRRRSSLPRRFRAQVTHRVSDWPFGVAGNGSQIAKNGPFPDFRRDIDRTTEVSDDGAYGARAPGLCLPRRLWW